MAAFISRRMYYRCRAIWRTKFQYRDLYNICRYILHCLDDIIWSLTHTWLWNTSVKDSTLELYLDKIQREREREAERREGETESDILSWENDDTRWYVFGDNTLALLNLPNNTSDNNTRWSRNLKRCQKDSPDLVTKVQLRSTKTSWADKVPDNFAILRIQLVLFKYN